MASTVCEIQRQVDRFESFARNVRGKTKSMNGASKSLQVTTVAMTRTALGFVSPLVEDADRKYRCGSCEIFWSRCPDKIETHSDSDEPRGVEGTLQRGETRRRCGDGYRNSENITKYKKKGERCDRKRGKREREKSEVAAS